MRISARAQSIQESPIRKLSALAIAAKKRGTTVYHLNIGQPDIHTPAVFLQKIIAYGEKVLSYGPSDGLEALKEAMAKIYDGISFITFDDMAFRRDIGWSRK